MLDPVLEIIASTEWDMLLIGSLAVLVGSIVQGASGLGLGMVAAPVLILIDPRFVPGPLLMLSFAVSSMMVWREYRRVDLRGLCFALTGRIPGNLLAGMTIAMVPQSVYGIVFGTLVLAAVALTSSGLKFMPTPRNLFSAGVASGYMGTLTSVGAPPIALAYQHGTAPTIRATLAAFFMISSALSILTLHYFGRFDYDESVFSLLFVVPLALGFWISNSLVRLMKECHVRYAILGLSGVSSIILILRSTYTLIS